MANKTTNSCPVDVFIRKLAQELDTTLEIARHIYETMTTVTVELLEEYDSVKPITFVDVERQQTEEKKRYNPITGEVDVVQPKDKVKASVSRHYKEYDKVHEFVDRRTIRMEKQKIRETQLAEEREEKRKELEEHKRKMRRNARRRTKYKQQKERQRQRAIERLIEDEMRIEAEEKRQYEKDLRKRLKG